MKNKITLEPNEHEISAVAISYHSANLFNNAYCVVTKEKILFFLIGY